MRNLNKQNYIPETVSINEDSYLNSFLYYKITGRKSAWIYKNNQSFVVVSQHPHKHNTLLVFAEGGETNYDLTAMVLQHLYRGNYNIQLARYTTDNIQQLKQALRKLNNNLVEDIQIYEEDLLDWFRFTG